MSLALLDNVFRPQVADRKGVWRYVASVTLLAWIVALSVDVVHQLLVFVSWRDCFIAWSISTVVVIGILALIVVGLGSLAYRARRGSRPKNDPTILEARNVGGHTWVAYSWDKRGR